MSSELLHLSFLTFRPVHSDWLSGDLNTPIYWQTVRKGGLAWHTAEAFAPQTFDEQDEKVMSGKIVLATDDVSHMQTWRRGISLQLLTLRARLMISLSRPERIMMCVACSSSTVD